MSQCVGSMFAGGGDGGNVSELVGGGSFAAGEAVERPAAGWLVR